MPPQFTDEEIDRQLETGDTARHLTHCRRPPLGQCSEAEFEEDLYAFLTERGEGELANDLRNKRINWYAHSQDRRGGITLLGLLQLLGRWLGHVLDSMCALAASSFK